MTDNDLSKRVSGFIVPERAHCIVELKHAIDDWPQAIYRYRPVHRIEVCSIAGEDHTDRCGCTIEKIHVDRRRLVGQAADEVDESIERHGFEGLLERASADVHYLINPAATCQIPHGKVPVW